MKSSLVDRAITPHPASRRVGQTDRGRDRIDRSAPPRRRQESHHGTRPRTVATGGMDALVDAIMSHHAPEELTEAEFGEATTPPLLVRLFCAGKLDGRSSSMDNFSSRPHAVSSAVWRPPPPTRHLRCVVIGGSATSLCRGPFDGAARQRAVKFRAKKSLVSLESKRTAVGFESASSGARVALHIGEAWTILSWVHFPLRDGSGAGSKPRTHTLAMGLPSEAEDAPADHARPLCHVQIIAEAHGKTWFGVEHEAPRPAARAPDAPPSARERATTMLPGVDLSALPHGWHHVGAVGAGGATRFYVDGRACGEVAAQVTAPILWLGNHTACDGRPCGALGSLFDLRVYGAALSAAALRELDAGGARSLAGGGADGHPMADRPMEPLFQFPGEGLEGVWGRAASEAYVLPGERHELLPL